MVMGKLGVTKATHLWDNQHDAWKLFEEKLNCICGVPIELKDITIHLIDSLQETSGILAGNMIDFDLWSWSNDLPTNGGFSLTNQQTYLLLEEQNEWVTLNSYWKRNDME